MFISDQMLNRVHVKVKTGGVSFLRWDASVESHVVNYHAALQQIGKWGGIRGKPRYPGN
ncbi:hypothetical protein R69746_04495 [Paraburkholderia aspalathi]|nr:hypothetical protein R69746_04495 [Paraburkholderia aspalathi]